MLLYRSFCLILTNACGPSSPIITQYRLATSTICCDILTEYDFQVWNNLMFSQDIQQKNKDHTVYKESSFVPQVLYNVLKKILIKIAQILLKVKKCACLLKYSAEQNSCKYFTQPNNEHFQITNEKERFTVSVIIKHPELKKFLSLHFYLEK